MAVAVKLSDNFNDNSIDINKWSETDPGSQIAESGSQIQIANPHTAAIAEFANYLKSVVSISSGIVCIQGYLTWITDSANEALGGIYLAKDSSNFARITSRSTGGKLRIDVITGGVSRYSLETTIDKGKDVKIEYDVSATTVKFFYWNGTAWVQMGTTQTFNLGTPLYYYITAGDNSGFTGANTIIIDNAYLVRGSYSINPPINVYDSGFLALL